MKRFILASMLGWAAIGMAAQQPAANRPFSPDELERFRALGAIDVHAHVFAPDRFGNMLEKLNLHIVNILVADDMSTLRRDLDTQRRLALSEVPASHGYAKLCTSFDPYSFARPDYAGTVVRGLDDDFAKGAIAVKVWKNVGMEIKDANGLAGHENGKMPRSGRSSHAPTKADGGQ
jgi:hypothetical protein